MAVDWTPKEVALIVEDYFRMLAFDLKNQKYNKSSSRYLLLPQLNNRSEGSIEFKHQNISAVLAQVGTPFIKGYKPRSNYQRILEDEVLRYLANNQIALEKEFHDFSDKKVIVKPIVNFDSMIDTEPIQSIVSDKEPTYRPIKINFLEREQNNRQLGEAGESLVINFEKWRLIKAGKEKLADKVEWISKDLGDGTGFDILSKNENGTDRFIEVKTTKLTKETPIFLSKNEVSFAKLKAEYFYLYRIFNFDTSPKFFVKNGEYQSYCKLLPQTFKGYF